MIRRWPAITVHRPVLDNRHVIGAMKKHYPAIGDHIVGKPAVHAAAPGVMCPDRDQHVATDGIKTITHNCPADLEFGAGDRMSVVEGKREVVSVCPCVSGVRKQ